MKIRFDNSAEKWAEIHEHMQDLLAGYVDDELDKQEALLVEAHLAGCEDCRNDVARQQILSQRLEAIPSPRMTSALQQRIDKMFTEELPDPLHTQPRSRGRFLLFLNRLIHNVSLPPVLGASGWGIALLFAIILFAPPVQEGQNSEIPMINDALAEYHKMKGKAFPVANKNSTLEAPVNWSNAHTLATWTTNVAGAPAQVFALRSGHNIVFQYQVDETVFFRNPVVRQAISESGNFRQSKNKTDVLALPLSDSGVLVIGPSESLPTPDKIEF